MSSERSDLVTRFLAAAPSVPGQDFEDEIQPLRRKTDATAKPITAPVTDSTGDPQDLFWLLATLMYGSNFDALSRPRVEETIAPKAARNTRRVGAYLLAAAAVCAILFLVIRPGSAPLASRGPGVVLDDLFLVVPAASPAGEPFVVDVVGADAGEQIILEIDGGYGPREIRAVATGEETQVDIPSATRAESGVVTVTARVGRRVAVAVIELTPDDAVDPTDVYLGPRTVVADGEHFSMLVAVPKDRFGNPVADGTVVDYLVTRPNGVTQSLRAETEGLLSFVRVYSRTVTGRTRIGVSVDGASAVEESFVEVAGIPAPYGLSVIEEVPVADGHALITIRTDRLVDQFGNEMPDGVAVYLDTAGSTGRGRLRAVTIDGSAEFTIEVPDQPGPATFLSVVSGISSVPLEIVFEEAVRRIPVDIRPDEDGWEIVIGEVLTTRQSYVPDATVATIVVGDREYEAFFQNGVASRIVAPTESGPYTVTVLGRTVTFRSPEEMGG